MGMHDGFTYDNQLFLTGDSVSCTIRGVVINNAKIYVLSRKEIDQAHHSATRQTNFDIDKVMFICHNNEYTIGQESPNLLGYQYSWYCMVEHTNGINNNLLQNVFDFKRIDTKEDKLAAIVDLAFSRGSA